MMPVRLLRSPLRPTFSPLFTCLAIAFALLATNCNSVYAQSTAFLPSTITSFENGEMSPPTISMSSGVVKTIVASASPVTGETDTDSPVIDTNYILPPSPRVTDGRRALEVTYPATVSSPYPNVIFTAPSSGWNWSVTGILAMEVNNPTSSDITYNLEVDDTSSNARSATFVLKGNTSRTIAFHVDGSPSSPYDVGKTVQIASTSGSFDLTHIGLFKVSVSSSSSASPATSQILDLDDIVAMPSVKTLQTFETSGDLPGSSQLSSTNVNLVSPGPTNGSGNALEIEFLTSTGWPTVSWLAPSGTSWDWGNAPVMCFEAKNTGATEIGFNVRLDDSTAATGLQHSYTGYAWLEPGQSGTFAVTFGGDIPPLPAGTTLMGQIGANTVDPSHIIAYHIFVTAPTSSKKLAIDNMRLVPCQRMLASFEGDLSATCILNTTQGYSNSPSISQTSSHWNTLPDGTRLVPGDGATSGNQSIKILFNTAGTALAYSAVSWQVNSGNDWDWRGVKAFAFDAMNPVQNTEDNSKPNHSVALRWHVDDYLAFLPNPASYTQGKYDYGGIVNIPPDGLSHTYVMYLNPPRSSKTYYGMKWGPPYYAYNVGYHDPLTFIDSLQALTLAPDQSVGNEFPQINLGKMHRIVVAANKPSSTDEIYLDNVRLLPSQTDESRYIGIVDQYGQDNLIKFSGKFTGSPTLATQASSEVTDMSANSPGGRDNYGGWGTATSPYGALGVFTTTIGGTPTSDPPTYFKTYQDSNGKWWLVDPANNPFWSLGVNTVNRGGNTVSSAEQGTSIAANSRKAMFSAIPSSTDNQVLNTSTTPPFVSFYNFNLTSKYSNTSIYSNYKVGWYNTTLLRLPSWGFNTIGNWSDGSIEQSGTIPFVHSLTTTPNGSSHAVIQVGPLVSGVGTYGTIDDPYTTQFETDCDNSFSAALSLTYTNNSAKHLSNDPMCIGYYVNNEMPWTGGSSSAYDHYVIPYSVLNTANTGPQCAKAMFLNQLQTKYGTLSALNAAWNTTYPGTNWSVLDAAFTAPGFNTSDTGTNAMYADMSIFLEAFADQYFSKVNTKMKQYTSQLYIGCRFAQNKVSWETIRSAAKYCDVVSFNLYQQTFDLGTITAPSFASLTYDSDSMHVNTYRPDWLSSSYGTLWNTISTISTTGVTVSSGSAPKKTPCLVSEFSFGTLASGLFGANESGSIEDTLALRGTTYKSYVQTIMTNPAFIGAHWFEYVDQPLTGRLVDGENVNMGLVSVTDAPYSDLISKARETNDYVYHTRNTGSASAQP